MLLCLPLCRAPHNQRKDHRLIQSKSPPPSQPFGVRGATSASVGRMAKRRCGKSRGPGPRYFPLFGFALRFLVSETGIFQYTWVCLHTRVLVTVWRCLRHRMGRAHSNLHYFYHALSLGAQFIYVKSIWISRVVQTFARESSFRAWVRIP